MKHKQQLVIYCIIFCVQLVSFVTALSSSSNGPLPTLPKTSQDIIRQASYAISHAFTIDNINHQSIRLPLSESMYSDKEEGFVADRAVGWQGGPQETLRFLSPLATSLLKDIKLTKEGSDGGIPPRIKEQLLLDFDGSALLTAESPSGPLYDVQALLQANTDSYYLDTIAKIEEQFSDTLNKPRRLFVLVNSAWRDKSSWGFFGGQRAQKLILDRYETTYAIDQFVVKGQKISLLKVWPYDWCVYCSKIDYGGVMEEGDNTGFFIGSFKERPKYSEMEDLVLRES